MKTYRGVDVYIHNSGLVIVNGSRGRCRLFKTSQLCVSYKMDVVCFYISDNYVADTNLLLVSWGGVRPSRLGTPVTIWHIVPFGAGTRRAFCLMSHSFLPPVRTL
jgi:hypothetical protein